jgi:anthranilate synthase/aminodeoxychorismate synthase-like glutamine amidotransferase
VAVVVKRNDQTNLDAIRTLHPERIVISPGPGRPEEAGITLDVIRTFGPTVPILGVCLGHQAMGLAFGARIVRAPLPVHGKTSAVDHDGQGLFAGLGNGFRAGRYHSLVVAEEGFPGELTIAARTRDEGIIMGLRHRVWPLHGVQFHPESVLTQEGRRILRNFLSIEAPPVPEGVRA